MKRTSFSENEKHFFNIKSEQVFGAINLNHNAQPFCVLIPKNVGRLEKKFIIVGYETLPSEGEKKIFSLKLQDEKGSFFEGGATQSSFNEFDCWVGIPEPQLQKIVSEV